MTAPRQVIAESHLMLTRRVTQRKLLLRPDARTVQIYTYCLAEAAERFNVTLYGWIAMSNHEHVLVCDLHGNGPEFMAHFRKMLAKAMNRYRGRSENFWSSEQANVVRLFQPTDLFEKLVYMLANPVAAELVDRASDWPGATSLMQNISGREVIVKRPVGYFRDKGPMPKEVVLRVTRIPGYEHLTADEWRDKLLGAVRHTEERARASRLATQRPVLGRKAVLATDPESRPSRAERPRRVRPHIAARDPKQRVEALRAMTSFRAAHRAARQRFRAGDREVIFPEGTYKMRRLGARCADDPPRPAALSSSRL